MLGRYSKASQRYAEALEAAMLAAVMIAFTILIVGPLVLFSAATNPLDKVF